MIKTCIEIDGNNRTFYIPDSWLELKLKHLINLELWKGNENDPIGLLSCFIDLDAEIIANSKRDHWTELITILSFVFDPPKWHNLKVQRKVKLSDKLITIPRKLELERFGQKVLALQYMSNIKEDSQNLSIIPDVMAVYFQPLYDGKFSRYRLRHIKSLIMEMPAIEAIPIGRFFFRKLIKSRNFGWLGLKVSQLIMKKILYSRQQGGIS